MEDLYQDIFGKKPAKRGTAYELIVGTVLKLLNQDTNITHNIFFKSPYSSDKYQIDNLCEADGLTFVEAKDYSQRGGKVGRGDVAKLAGALCVLKGDIDKGLLASATDFTKTAKQFTSDFLKSNGIPIDLLVIRKSVTADTEGTIQKIVVNMNMLMPDFERAEFSPVWTKQGQQALETIGYKEGDTIQLKISYFCKSDGSVYETISHLTSKLDVDYKELLAEGKWQFREPAYIKIDNALVQIKRVEYRVPYVVDERRIQIDAGEPAILVRSIDGAINKIITVEDLKKIDVNENGTYDTRR